MIRIDGVRLLDPATGIDRVQTVWLQGGQRLEAEAHSPVDEVINGDGLWLVPALVDLCARLREPGQQQHGTLASEGHAARRHGILHLITPPDTRPVLESGALIPGLRQKALRDGGIHLHPLGAMTQGLAGAQPANMAALQKGGCIAVSNARHGFAGAHVLLSTLEYAATLDLPVFFYPEDPWLAQDGCVHDGFMASRQGLAGIPSVAETVALAKQLLLVRETGVTAHFGLLSCGDSVALLRAAQAQGLPVSASVAMHQLFLTDAEVDGFNALAHVRPPLRSDRDREQLRQGVADGVIAAICSHHEPLSASAKLAPFAETEAGISALDTFVPLGLQLVRDGVLTPLQWLARVVTGPAQVANIEAQRQAVGGWVLMDPARQWRLQADTMASMGKNTPFLGQTMTGCVLRLFDQAAQPATAPQRPS